MLRTGLILVFMLSFMLFDALFASKKHMFDFFSPNSTIARKLDPGAYSPTWKEASTGFALLSEMDTTQSVRILMVDFCSYDTAYPQKIKGFLQKHLPKSNIQHFRNGSVVDLELALGDRQVAVLSYPSNCESASLPFIGAALKTFAEKGGCVIITGTHEYSQLRQMALLDLDYGYYFAEPNIHDHQSNHVVTKGMPSNFELPFYAYPLDVSDPDFVTWADVNGYSAAGYKPFGKGNIVYLGFEYYSDEALTTKYLVNSVLWGSKSSPIKSESVFERKVGAKPRRATIRLAPGDIPGKESVNLKIYPNPYAESAEIDIAIAQATPVSIEMADQTGSVVAIVLERKTLAAGRHILELPNVTPGVYYVKCKTGDVTMIRKIVKINAH